MSGSAHPVDADIDRCARVIAVGGVAVVPTDTLYGLAAGITAPAAVARVAAIKGRAPGTGMPVLLASSEQLALVGSAAPYLEELGAAFWPGGVTLVIPARPEIDRRIADARGTVAVRVPGMATTREVCRRAGAPDLPAPAPTAAGTRPPPPPPRPAPRLVTRWTPCSTVARSAAPPPPSSTSPATARASSAPVPSPGRTCGASPPPSSTPTTARPERCSRRGRLGERRSPR